MYIYGLPYNKIFKIIKVIDFFNIFFINIWICSSNIYLIISEFINIIYFSTSFFSNILPAAMSLQMLILSWKYPSNLPHPTYAKSKAAHPISSSLEILDILMLCPHNLMKINIHPIFDLLDTSNSVVIKKGPIIFSA